MSVTCEAGEAETVLTIEVPEMEKKAVAGAVEGPLQRAVEQNAGGLRWRDVVVRFTGDALIGSAMKDAVKSALVAARPARVTVRRGYGDEVVLESEAPRLDVSTAVDGDSSVVTIDTGELESEDLPRFFAPVLADVAGRADGARLTLAFEGAAKPDSALRERIAAELRDAGAIRVAIGARVLFDKELTDRCRVEERDDDVVVTIDPAPDPAVTGEAMETVLPDHALGFAGKPVRVHWKSSPDSGEGDHFVRIASGFAPEHVEFVVDGGEPKVVWPAVLELVVGRERTLRVRPNGRSHTEVLEAFPRECADLEGELRGHDVVVDWPKLFVIDEDTERCLADSMAEVGPKSVCCTVAGEDREPFLPPPVTFADEDERCTVTVLTDAGRPAELVRAAERALPRFVARVAGKPTRLVIRGEAPATRTLLRAVLDRVVEAGPSRVEVEDHGPVDVLLPPMLVIARSGEHGVHIEVDPGGRDEAQQAMALARELDEGALPKDAVVTIARSPLDEQLLEALIAHGAESVSDAEGNQLYPEVLPEPEPLPEPEAESLPEPEAEAATGAEVEPHGEPAVAAAAGTGAALAPVRVLAHNNEAIPPTVLLGVEAGDDEAHVAAIERELGPNLPRFQRRAVMVVLQQDGQDVPARKPGAMVQMLSRVLPSGAAATLLFRGPDAQGRPHFQVVHSTLRAMPVGANFRDPRGA